MKTSIATVSLSGSLTEKLHACAAAGFDGVEIFEPDLIASDHSPEEIRALARRLGLSLDLYQPLRDIEGVDEDTFADNLRRAGATFATAQRLGIRHGPGLQQRRDRDRRLRRGVGRPAAPTRRPRRGIRHQGGVRGAGLGPVRRRLPPGLAHRRACRPSERRGVPRQLPRAVPRPRPGGDRGHPRPTRSSSCSSPTRPR